MDTVIKIDSKKWIEKIVSSSKIEHQKYIQKASDNFVLGSDNCSEAIADVFSEIENMPKEIYKGMVSGFGKGIAGKNQTCGALLTGISFISKIAYEHKYNKKQIREFSSHFYDKFQKEFSSTLCSVLSQHNCDQNSRSDFDLYTCGKYLAFTTKEILEFKETINSN